MIHASTIKTLKIDERDFSARHDETILDVARQNGIFIPKICDLKGLSPVGACRLCLVEVKGTNRLLPACSTLVEEGMEVTTNSRAFAALSKIDSGAAVHGAQPCLLGVRIERTLRTADAGAEAGHHPRALPLPLSAS